MSKKDPQPPAAQAAVTQTLPQVQGQKGLSPSSNTSQPGLPQPSSAVPPTPPANLFCSMCCCQAGHFQTPHLHPRHVLPDITSSPPLISLTDFSTDHAHVFHEISFKVSTNALPQWPHLASCPTYPLPWSKTPEGRTAPPLRSSLNNYWTNMQIPWLLQHTCHKIF